MVEDNQSIFKLMNGHLDNIIVKVKEMPACPMLNEDYKVKMMQKIDSSQIFVTLSPNMKIVYAAHLELRGFNWSDRTTYQVSKLNKLLIFDVRDAKTLHFREW